MRGRSPLVLRDRLCRSSPRRRGGQATLYRVASITKTFTGTAIMQLREAGRLDLDDAVANYVPEVRQAAPRRRGSSRSPCAACWPMPPGWRAQPPGTDWTVPLYEGLTDLGQPGAVVTRIPPSQHPKYSNLAYHLLGEVITRVSGVSYPRYIRGRRSSSRSG